MLLRRAPTQQQQQPARAVAKRERRADATLETAVFGTASAAAIVQSLPAGTIGVRASHECIIIIIFINSV